MSEEHRLTAAEVLQYFLSRYKVDNGTVDSDRETADEPLTAGPIAAADSQDEAETGDE